MRKYLHFGLVITIVLMVVLSGCGSSNTGVSDVTSGLVAYYPFNGNANDVVGSANSTYVGPGISFTAQDRFGNSSKACSFDGTAAAVISISSITLAPSTSFSISLWIYNSNSTTGTPVYGPPLAIYQQNGKISFDISSDLAINGDVTPNTWTHVVGTYDNTSKVGSLYINGGLIHSFTRTSALGSIDLSGFSFGGFWTGIIDDCRIYNRVLSASEINQLNQFHNN